MNFTEVCPTVAIMTDNGPVRINASEYDENVHTLVTGDEPAPVVESDLPGDPAPFVPFMVLKDGKKYFVVNAMGVKAAGVEGINDAGYAVEADAYAALAAVTTPAAQG